jgi:hypothetical protein
MLADKPQDVSSQDTEKPQSKGGIARAESLTPEQRKIIARKAALSRWDAGAPVATHEGDFNIGETPISAAVLQNGKRLLTQATFLRAMGRSRSPKAGTGVLSTVDGLPFFLQAEALKPFISEELMVSTTPIFYRTKEGGRSVGYDAELLPRVCEVYLKLRDDSLAKTGKIPPRYKHIITACDMLMRGLATVGIVALVDEATGYQRVRDQEALQAILQKFLRKELAEWAKTFPNEFYEEIYRLKGWPWRGMGINRYSIVGRYTIDLVYERLAPELITELEKRNPRDAKGNRKAKHFQWLTDDIGHPALRQHLFALITLMRSSDTWDDFYDRTNRSLPRKGQTYLLPFTGTVEV